MYLLQGVEDNATFPCGSVVCEFDLLVYPGVSWFKETQYTKSKFVKWGIHESVFVLPIRLLSHSFWQ